MSVQTGTCTRPTIIAARQINRTIMLMLASQQTPFHIAGFMIVMPVPDVMPAIVGSVMFVQAHGMAIFHITKIISYRLPPAMAAAAPMPVC